MGRSWGSWCPFVLVFCHPRGLYHFENGRPISPGQVPEKRKGGDSTPTSSPWSDTWGSMYSTCLGCTWESMHHASWLRCIIEFAEVQTSPRQTSHSFGPRERHGVQVQSTSFSARPSLSRSRGDPAEPQPEPGHSSTCACLQESEPLLVFEGVNCQETKPFSRRLQSNTKQVEPPVAAFLFFRDILICLCSLWVCLLS